MSRVGKRPPNVAATSSEIVYRENKLKVLHYLPQSKNALPVPIFIVPSLINKYYILDLLPGKSFVEFLTAQGFAVYLVDWGVVDAADREITLEKYIGGYLANALAAVLRHADASRASLIGYCMGGTMALIYAALNPKQIKNLVLLATPVDFHNDSLLSVWAQNKYLDSDKLVDTYGNIPVSVLQSTFLMLKPAKSLMRYNQLVANADNPEFVETFLAFDFWANDAVPVAGETFRKFVKDTYQNNLLAQNKMRLGDKTVNLKKIKCPLLNITAEHDDIVPSAASEIITEIVSSKDSETLRVKGGHHGITVGPSALKIVWTKTAEWLRERS